MTLQVRLIVTGHDAKGKAVVASDERLTAVSITEWAPGHARFTHRTETVDYAILLSGETDLELENRVVVHLKPGDVVVQRGTTHTWINRGSVPIYPPQISAARALA
jgi:uncharacterized cupin superfamily protein